MKMSESKQNYKVKGKHLVEQKQYIWNFHFKNPEGKA